MEARVSVSGGADELTSLRQWLTAEDEFRGRVRVQRAPIEPDQMGVVADALQVALSDKGALTVLAGSVAVWLRQRRSKLKVKIVNPDGSTQEITASGPAADAIAPKIGPDNVVAPKPGAEPPQLDPGPPSAS
ncbi:effector-associated constant component EACC1 [Actinocrispum wychmicini]|uniref:Uncharacterized protein n=1 Tax=Actinocrispum wychmicini TaxID=1213861 RepID=A0A4R2J1R0_9PSEU|nr:hypothetical protein [Actinocrispum wychmicini]TCO50678.1 hypothetical protein EV192_11355 [Actinocrispum wychmicini]